MCRVLSVLFVVSLANAAVRFPRGYGIDNSAYLHHNEESKLDNTLEKFKSNLPADGGRKGSGLTESQKEGVINLCSTSDNGEDKTDHVADRNKKTDSISVTDDKEKLDVRYMKITDNTNRNDCKNRDTLVNSASETDNDFTITKSETTLTNSDTATITIGLSGSSYITEKSRIDENISKTETSASNIGKTENDMSKINKPSYSSSFSIIEHTSDSMSSGNNLETEITSTGSDIKHLLTVESSSDASFDKHSDIHKSLSNNGYESLVITTISNIPLISDIAVKEEIKSSHFNNDQSNSSENFKTDVKSITSDENGKATTDFPPFVSASGIDVNNEFKSSSNTNNEHSNSESLSNSYSNFHTDRQTTNLEENIVLLTGFPVVTSKDGDKSSIDASSPTSSVSLIEPSSKTLYIGGSKHDTKEATIPIKYDSISHDVHTSDKISDSSFNHVKSITEGMNHENNYSAVSSHTTSDSITIDKAIPSYKEVNKNENIPGANHKDTIQTDKNKENVSIILIIVGQNKHGRFEGNKGGHEVHHYNAGHHYSHESDSSDSSYESDESWEKDHNRHHQNDGHHYSHESDSSDDSSIESNESWIEGHNFRFYEHEYDNNDASEDLGDSWIG